MAALLLSLKGIALTFGGTPLITGADLTVAPGERLCLVGRNGSGKSTLLKIAAGLVLPDDGERFAHPEAVIRYLPQDADLTGFATTLDYVAAGLKPTDERYQAEIALAEVGLTGNEEPLRLSGGEARRAALARVLAPRPDVLLLDEPTNHLDLPAIEWLEKTLSASRAAIVVISHDRRFLETLSRSVVWLDRGVTRRMERGFGEFEGWRDRLIEEEETERHKLDRKIVREDQWMHGGISARRKRNVRRVAELGKLRAEVKARRHHVGEVRLEAADAEVSGKLVAEAHRIAKSFGGRPVVADLSLRVMRGDRLAIVGPNGAGKTTLLNLLTGAIPPDSGTIRLGTNLVTVYLDQRRDDLDPEMTLSDALTGGRSDQVVINGKARHVASYMKDFLFLAEQARSPIRVLSGGERGRLVLARALAKPSNLLILDEPTNDLDLETLDLLQELLTDYAGTVLLVSHDRDFLDRVATSVLAPDGDGRWIEYAGGYTDMLAQRGGEAPRKVESRGAGKGDAAKAAGADKPAASGGAGPSAGVPGVPAAGRKLSFKEKHALETLPARIAAFEAEAARLAEKLARADLYTADPGGFAAATAELARVQAELAAAEDQWLELEAKREGLA
ncbi:MAG: ATP-binding cassette domain-containing protein [Hyphomicrobiaceae bacterium]|nr:ATP-binding cassette domain-containing protein [Hyphomicrobiaceae bacterium]